MKAFSSTIIAALLFVLSAPAASAASLSQNINCALAKTADHTQCVEDALTISYALPDPIGVVAYATPRCSYFIIHTDEQFVIARDVDKKDSVRRGDAIYANPREDGTDFRRGKSPLMVGSTEVRSLILDTHADAHAAAVAYMAKCGR